ncbi:recombinase family protein [Vibrio sp. 1982]|uniref:recombinase family protein n=1 Tax=Vibrio sp. 1982 TaxID=3074586 RepID=UPI0029644430|nr:recombinase family protein [Vibrio sp. 1982]MDW2216192.1 recombinase family protein [Vibrio sp. 1982]
MQYGYLVLDNDDGMQRKALEEYGCDEVIEGDSVALAVQKLEPGDLIIVWRMDKLANDVPGVKQVIDDVIQAGANVLSLNERFNSTTADMELLDKIMDTISFNASDYS